MNRRIINAWKRYWSLRDIMKSSEYKVTIKRKLFNVCILPILTYGCQTWTMSQSTQQKLRTCQRSIERSILGFKRKDKKRATELRKITKFEDVIKKTRQMKWRWTGHMLREPKEKWTKSLTEWIPRYNTKRKRGRQRKRWSDDIKKVGGPLWIRLAKDRGKWKELEEAYVSQGHADPD